GWSTARRLTSPRSAPWPRRRCGSVRAWASSVCRATLALRLLMRSGRAGATAMPEAITAASLVQWQRDPIAFIEHVLRDPESGKPFVLSDAERRFLQLAFTLDDGGRLLYPELVFGAIKKSGKTTLAAIIMIAMVLLYGGRYAEGYCVANDLEQ